MLHSAQEVYNYSGIYISYSLSSSSNALKVEPYLITPADSNDHVKVVHMSAYNTTHFGTAVFNNHQNAYIFFNEREAPQLALSTIYLQLPMYDFPHLLKGLYLCLVYNIRNNRTGCRKLSCTCSEEHHVTNDISMNINAV